MEEWRDIEGYKGLYQVSNMGRVKSLERTVWNNSRGCYVTVPERIRKAKKNNKGYLMLGLSKDAKVKCYLVHRLVATAFVENPEGYTEVNHKDENKENNKAENLEYCSRSYNNSYNGRAKKAAKKIAEKRKKPVFSVDKESGLITYWESAKEAGEVLGIAPTNITRCCKGRKKSIGGFYWFYADSEEVCDEKK